MNRRSFLIDSLGVALASMGLTVPNCASANDLIVGQAAPPLTLHTLDGKDLAISDFIGHVVIVTFWASYCDPCREELPVLSDYAKKHQKDGLQVLGFCIDPPDNVDEVRQVAKTLSFPVGLLGSQYAGGYGRIWRMPVSFVINRKGILVDDGWKDKAPIWTAERLKRIMDPLLAKAN